MIDEKDYTSWENKIILAPNASGKSRTSRKLYEKSNKEKTKLFSQEKINELISVNAKQIFVGENSKIMLENNKIIETIEKSDFLRKFIKKEYAVTSTSKLKEKSLFFNKLDIKNLKSFDFFQVLYDKVEKVEIKEIINENTIENDKKYNIPLIKDIEEHILPTEDDLELNNDENQDLSKILPKEIIDYLNRLRDYTQDNNLKQCILCGNEREDILDEITSTIETYTPEDKENLLQTINILFSKYKNQEKDSSLEEIINISEKILLLKEYLSKAEENNTAMVNYFLNIEIENLKLREYIEIYKRNETKIKENIKNNSEREMFEKIVISEFESLVTLPQNIKIYFENGIITLKVDGEPQIISDVLSTSEIKRLGLAVLNAEINSSIIDYVIFDDPIDSYDDYYIRIASNYIAKMLTEGKIKYTVFTHLYELCYYVSTMPGNSKYKYDVYYQNPSYKIGEKGKTINDGLLDKRQLKSNQIKELNQNELILFHSLYKSENVDKKFLLVSMFPTIRSLINDINKKVQKINYINNDVTSKCDLIEEKYLHYSLSEDVNINDLIILSINLFKGNTIPLEEEGNKLIEIRKEYLQKSLLQISCENPIIKSILYKMLRIQECKYKMEEKINDIFKANNKNNLLSELEETHTLGRKLEFALEKIDVPELRKLSEIHMKYSTLINDYSHGFTRMISPYLMTSSYDLAKLEYEIENLQITIKKRNDKSID